MEIQMKVFYRGNYRGEASLSFHGVSFSKGVATDVTSEWYSANECPKLETEMVDVMPKVEKAAKKTAAKKTAAKK